MAETTSPSPCSPAASPPSSTSASPTSALGVTGSTPIIRASQPASFCIDALLQRPHAESMSPPREGSSPTSTSSPASSPFGSHAQQRPSLMSPASLFPTNPATGGSLYPYPGALLTAASAAASVATSNSPVSTAAATAASSVTSSLESVLKNGMNMQTVQLEWLARTGMLYHRFPELAGNSLCLLWGFIHRKHYVVYKCVSWGLEARSY